MLFRRYILLFLTLLSLSLQGQQYPVDIQVFATPPYPQSLRGYADTFEEKLQAHFLLKDLSTGGRPFVLRLSLENFQGQVIAQTPDYIAPYLLNLTPGVRRTLSNIDFKSLLKYENLYGINESTYNGLLPEGTYFLCLSLYDSATGRPVSNKGRAMLQVRRYAPPIPTMPQKGEVLTKKNAFQHIVFQWMPRDIAPFMQYEFTLKEVWDLSLVPEEAFMTGRLVYQTQTYAPALAYTNMMPILLENKRYVWQVRAFTNNPNNPNEPSYFKNNGNSETFYFDLVSHCEAPKFLTAISESTSAQLRWSAQAMMPNQEYPYKVMYRERGKSWKSQKVSMPNAKLTGLKRGRTYIYKVGVACGLNATHSSSVFGQESYMYSTEQEFTTTEQIDQKSQVQCGVKPQVRIKNTSPLQDNLYPNTTFTAGDFPVTVLNATGSNGVYSGEGYVKVPYLQDTKIKVSFTNIKLNTERQLIDGKLITTYDQTERNVQFVQEGIGEVFGDKGKKDQKMPFEIENQNNIQVDSISGRITITGKVDPKTGIAPKVTLPKGRDYVITDSKGKVYQLDENGKVTAQGTREEGTQLAQQAGKGDSKNPPIDNKHFKVEWLFNDELATDLTGDIPYKVLVKGKTSSFELRIQPADTTKYDFFFHTENGVKVEAESKGDGLYKITRKGAFDFAQEELWVVAKEKKDKKGKKEELIGKCILVHLSPKEVNVALVPTQSGKNLQEAIAKVQQIYEKVGVTLHITTEKPFDISDQLKNGTLPTENEFGDLSTYSPEQNAVIAKFATNRKPKDNTYYIFLVNDGTGDHGYMRLGGQYGFVYSTNARTIAHELGHGIFKLEHPFKGKNADKGKTTALMDYNNGQDFFYRDWKQINDPKVKLYAFQGQKEGLKISYKYIIEGHNKGIAPNGKVIAYVKATKERYKVKFGIDKDYYIHKIELYDEAGNSVKNESYSWDWTDFVNTTTAKSIAETSAIELVYNSAKESVKTYIYQVIDDCKYRFAEIDYKPSDGIGEIKSSKWKTKYLLNAEESCTKNFILDILEKDGEECSKEEIDEALKILNQSIKTPEKAVDIINNSCLSALRNLSYRKKQYFIDLIASQKKLKNISELAILRLMNALSESDYANFFNHLEANNNYLIKHFIDQIDDSYFFIGSAGGNSGGKNYTNFIGALVWMFNHNPASIEDRWGKNEDDFVKRTLNLNPITYSKDTESSLHFEYTLKENKGEYIASTGRIQLYDVYDTHTYNTSDIRGPGRISTHKEEPIGEVSPLTPLIIIPDKNKVPLIQTALEGNDLGNEVYIVPAIFLKYNDDKILNDYIETGVFTTLDIATIAISGGTALATKVHWIPRVWALVEVVGAVGNITANTIKEINGDNKELREIVDIYNIAMGAIGIKNLGQVGYKFAKNLPQTTKNILQKNGNLRTQLVKSYQDWKRRIGQLKASKKFEKLADNEKKLLEGQEEGWNLLGFVGDIKGVDRLKDFLTNDVRLVSLIKKLNAKFNKVDDFAKRFEELYQKVPENSVKPIDDLVDDLKHLFTEHIDEIPEGQLVAFLNELLETGDKFKAGATSLEVIRNIKSYLPAKFHSTLQKLELEDLISYADDAGDFRFDIKWKALNSEGFPISIFIDTKNYSKVGNMFQNLGQYKAYLEVIDDFDQLYIIQQGGRGITKEDIIKRLESAIAKDAEGVYYAKKQLWQKFRLKTPDELQKACETKALSQSSDFEKFRDIILITK